MGVNRSVSAGNAALAFGVVGSYMLCYRSNSNTVQDGIYAGTELRAFGEKNATDNIGTVALPGSWRYMGPTCSTSNCMGLFLRVS